MLREQKDDAVKIALRRELQVTSTGNRLKRAHDSTGDEDNDDDELPLLYPFDADQVSFIARCLLFCCMHHDDISFVNNVQVNVRPRLHNCTLYLFTMHSTM